MYPIPRTTRHISYQSWNILYQYAEDLRSNPLQFQWTIMTSMMRRNPRTMKMGEKDPKYRGRRHSAIGRLDT